MSSYPTSPPVLASSKEQARSQPLCLEGIWQRNFLGEKNKFLGNATTYVTMHIVQDAVLSQGVPRDAVSDAGHDPVEKPPANIRIYLKFLETGIIGLHFASACLCLSSFKIFWWVPKSYFISATDVSAVQGR